MAVACRAHDRPVGASGRGSRSHGNLSDLSPDATSYAADVLCRAVLETTSLAWWLLDPGIDAQKRLARSLVYRLHSANQTEKAINALQLAPEEDRADYGESVTSVQQEIRALGWTCNEPGPRVSFGDEGAGKESWLNYTGRAASLVARIWPQPRLPYAMLSAVAHAELHGLQRNLTQPADQPQDLRPAPGSASAVWLWQDTYLVSARWSSPRTVPLPFLASLNSWQRCMPWPDNSTRGSRP